MKYILSQDNIKKNNTLDMKSMQFVIWLSEYVIIIVKSYMGLITVKGLLWHWLSMTNLFFSLTCTQPTNDSHLLWNNCGRKRVLAWQMFVFAYLLSTYLQIMKIICIIGMQYHMIWAHHLSYFGWALKLTSLETAVKKLSWT